MLDLNLIVANAMKEITEEKTVEKLVKKQLEETITDVVQKNFNSWSSFGKSLEKHIESELNVNFKELNMVSYNDFVLKVIQESLDKDMYGAGREHLQNSLDNILKNSKEEYTLTELLDELRDEYRSEDDGDELTLHIERDGMFVHVSFDENDVSRYNCKYRLDFMLKDKSASDSDIYGKSLKPYHIKIEGGNPKITEIISGLSGVNAILYNMYLSGAELNFDFGLDADNYDLYHVRDEESDY